MKAPKNRRVFVIGYGAATPLGKTFPQTWERAVRGEAGFRKVTRCQVESPCNIVGEIPDWDPRAFDFSDEKEVYNWNASFVILTMAVVKEAMENAGLQMDQETGPRTACLIGSAINGTDAFRIAAGNMRDGEPLKVSPYLLPNLCANLPHLFTPRGLRLGKSRSRHRRPDDPGRRLRLCPGGRRGYAHYARNYSRFCKHERHHQG
jgi:3-oxoacyl-[acyl-carrier-protein] synthase II